MYIAFEGMDGTGTTTHSRELFRFLVNKRIPVTYFQDGKSGLLDKVIAGMQRGEIPVIHEALALLYATDRLIAQRSLVEEVNAILISDRSVISSWVYQSLNLPMSWVEEINRFARVPDIVFLLEAPKDVIKRRLAKRPGDPELFETDDMLHRVRNQYEKFKKSFEGCLFVIDTDRPFDIVSEEVLEILKGYWSYDTRTK